VRKATMLATAPRQALTAVMPTCMPIENERIAAIPSSVCPSSPKLQ
jgi:hypothetical protein